jgi:acetolactate synthase-1/2/3 large subunit
VINTLKNSKRPIILVGGGIGYEYMKTAQVELERLNLPVMTTWNGADRIKSTRTNYLGRPNTWGQRSANIIIQQSDLIIAIGTSLGLQQTGFNWAEFGKKAKIIHIDIDKFQLNNPHPLKAIKINIDSEIFLTELFLEIKRQSTTFDFQDWIAFGKSVRNTIPLNDPKNTTNIGYVKPYEFVMTQNQCIDENAILIPSSSGGAETVTMQTFETKGNQRILGNKSLASMGYGLAGAIGASLAFPEKQVVLNEGDGGFSQNLQELGTLERNSCNIKIFIWSNNGYASIRMTQQNYFDGAWVGCDKDTGLGLPDWKKLASAYNIPFRLFSETKTYDYHKELSEILSTKGPVLIEVPIDPEQSYYPKISSRVLENGTIVSNPLHLMTPELDQEIAESVFKYI